MGDRGWRLQAAVCTQILLNWQSWACLTFFSISSTSGASSVKRIVIFGTIDPMLLCLSTTPDSIGGLRVAQKSMESPYSIMERHKFGPGPDGASIKCDALWIISFANSRSSRNGTVSEVATPHLSVTPTSINCERNGWMKH